MVNVFLDDYYELAMMIVGLDPDGEDFEDEESVLLLLEEKFSIYSYDGFVSLIESVKLAVDSSIYPFDNYVPSVEKTKQTEIYGSYIPGDN